MRPKRLNPLVYFQLTRQRRILTVAHPKPFDKVGPAMAGTQATSSVPAFVWSSYLLANHSDRLNPPVYVNLPN